MGAMSFEFASVGVDIDRLAATIQIQGIDNAPWPGRVQRNNNVLTIIRQASESGRMSVSWPTDRGWQRIASGSLPEKNTPYRGELELARGFVNDLRNHIAIWIEAGLVIPEDLADKIDHATEQFIDAELTSNLEKSAELAVESINAIVGIIYQLSDSFAEQVAEIQKQYNRSLDFSFGIAGNKTADFPSNCDNLNWNAFCPSQIDASTGKELKSLKNHSSKTIFGPLVDVSPDGLAQLNLIDLGFEQQRQMLLSRIGQIKEIGDIEFDVCHAVGGIDGIGHRQMSFPHQLQIAMDAIHQVQTVTDKPVMASFCNPFGDQVARSLGGSFAIQIADEMLRRGAQISLLGLEINLDFMPQGDVTGQPFAWLDMLDQWGYFGIPLVILLRIPATDTAFEEHSDTGWKRQPVWHSMTFPQRIEYLSALMPLVGTRLGVQAVIWNNRFTDDGARFSAAHISNEHCSNGSDRHIFPIAAKKFLDQFNADV